MTRAAVIQMVSSSNVDENLQGIERFFIQAREEGVELLSLPENVSFMGKNERDKLIIAEEFSNGPIQERISQLAKHYSIWVIAGTIPLKGANKRVKASCIVYDNNGVCAARYDKIHLFDVRISEKEAHQESLTIERGTDVVVVDTPIGCVGLSVCYDLRFPELYHKLTQMGAQVFSVPSAFTAITGKAHWDVLLRARAIENLCYVLAPNQGGKHENGRQTYGHSLIVDPWGEVINTLNEGPGMVTANIDLEQLKTIRKNFPTNEHHIPEIIGKAGF